MKLFLFITLILLAPLNSLSKTMNEQIWNSLRFDFHSDKKKTIYSVEFNHRQKDTFRDFSQFFIRPMIGQRINNNLTIWFGVMQVWGHNSQNFREFRPYQLLNYKTPIKNSKLIFLSHSRLDQRFIQGESNMSLRFKQNIGLSYQFYESIKGSLHYQVFNESFFRLNNSQWAGPKGYEQNRFITGLQLKTNILNQKTQLNLMWGRQDFQLNRYNNLILFSMLMDINI